MDNLGASPLISQLAEDLGWLEDHSRHQPELAAQAGRLRLASALVRNLLGPALARGPASPLHIAVVGGAGAGKSTIANFLTGSLSAEANPQAGFTRHPIAYVRSDEPLPKIDSPAFMGKLRLLPSPGPSNLDEDVFQLRTVPPDPTGNNLLHHFVIWDCPDMTTWASTGYIPRLLEIAGLADILVYVASDERYNDEVPTEFLRLFLEAGKPIVVCLTKMKEKDAPALLAHFQNEVLKRLPSCAVACLAIPYLSSAQLADPVYNAAPYRIPLMNQVAVLGDPPSRARKRAIQGAMNFLRSAQETLLQSTRRDVAALEAWRTLVHHSQADFDGRYRQEYLGGEKFHSFDAALVKLLELLEIPGLGKVVSNTLWVLRTPYRFLKGLVEKTLSRPPDAGLPEKKVLDDAFAGWLDGLIKEAAQRSRSHPLWAHLDEGFAGELTKEARERFNQGMRLYQQNLTREVDNTARAIYEDLEKNPAALAILRGGKFAIDLAAIGAAVAASGMTLWHDIILVPLAASMTHALVDLFGKQYVDSQRDQARNRQQSLMTESLSGPLAQWLVQWPSSGGSTFERLQLALNRIPTAIHDLGKAVDELLARKEPEGRIS